MLNDVTVTQSSAVWELHELAPHTRARDLFAYAGAALPVLILVMLYDQPVLDALTSGQLAEEVVRTLAGSVGLVLAVPVTTALAVLVVKASARAREAGLPHLDGPRPAAAAEATDAGALEAVHQSRRARREAEAQAAPTR